MSAQISGYVYVAAAYDDGLLKIGFTRQRPERRMAQLSTGIAGRFELLHVFESSHPRSLEKALHDRFAGRRALKSREFFKVTVDEVKAAVREIDEEIRYAQDLAKAQAMIDSSIRWAVRGKTKMATGPRAKTWKDKIGSAAIFLAASAIAAVINAWILSGFSIEAMTKNFPLMSYFFLPFVPLGWVILFGLIFAATRIVRVIDWPLNRAEIEELRWRLASEMRLKISDLKI